MAASPPTMKPPKNIIIHNNVVTLRNTSFQIPGWRNPSMTINHDFTSRRPGS